MEFENKVLSKEILYKLYESGKTISTAESCTSGRIAEVLTSVPGASMYYKGGTICYSNEAKINILGVDADLIAYQARSSSPQATHSQGMSACHACLHRQISWI